MSRPTPFRQQSKRLDAQRRQQARAQRPRCPSSVHWPHISIPTGLFFGPIIIPAVSYPAL